MARILPRHLRPPRPKRPKPSRLGVVGGVGALGIVALVVAVAAVGLPAKRVTALRQGQAVWSVKCNLSHQAPDDPIVLPARPGASHLHDFFGNVSVNASTTTASLARAASTCLKGPAGSYLSAKIVFPAAGTVCASTAPTTSPTWPIPAATAAR
jgi:Domain of unknown function (DUF1996)